ncbi:MAG: hypothetical protein JF606_26070 [Burkholderiales bacterium]|nr:hypothetical protein [Burkholderiales bacterium]
MQVLNFHMSAYSMKPSSGAPGATCARAICVAELPLNVVECALQFVGLLARSSVELGELVQRQPCQQQFAQGDDDQCAGIA